MTERTGSFPLMDIANHYGLSLDVVYCAAWSLKRFLTKQNGDDYWPTWGIAELDRLDDKKRSLVTKTILIHISRFCKLQGSAL